MLSTAAAPPIAHAIGGAIGTAISLSLLYPLERARIEMQNDAFQSSIQQMQDEQRLTNDHLEMDRLPPSTAKALRSVLERRAGGQPTALKARPMPQHESRRIGKDSKSPNQFGGRVHRGPASSVTESTALKAAAIAAEANPNAEKPQTIRGTLVDLHKRKELYKGMLPVAFTLAASQFVFFYLHAIVKNLLLARFLPPGAKPTALLLFVTSTVAGVANVFITNPMWLVNLNIVTGKTETTSLVREMGVIVKKRGLKHLWKGTAASLLLVANPIIQFFCYEQFKLMILSTKKSAVTAALNGATSRTVLLPLEAFMLGALAKAIATSSTYPLQLAQTIQRLDATKIFGSTMKDTLSKIYGLKGYTGLFQGMPAKLLQTVLTAAFTFLSYETLLGIVQRVLVSASGM